MDTSIKASEQLTVERHRRRQKLTRKRLYCATPEGVEVTAEVLLQPLTNFLAGRLPDNPPPPPPEELNERLGRIADPYPTVALAILAPLLDAIARGWEGHDRDSWRMLLAKAMGEGLCHWLALKETERAEAIEAKLSGKRLIAGKRRGRRSTHKFLHSDWTSTQCVVAGDWMLDVATRLSCLDIDENKRLCIAPEWQGQIDRVCEDLERRHPVMLPHRSPPKDWTGWWANYGDRIRAPFVRDWRPETRKNHEATFESARPPAEPLGPFAELADLRYSLPFAHADGVNAIKRVPLRISQSLLPLVEKFAVELMGHDGKKLKADRKTVKADLRHARWCGNGAVYLDYNCDKRGRVLAVQQLNYAREDHVRALFEFDRGEPLSADGVGGVEALQWLEIHAANCGPGAVDKKPWADRLRWAKEHTDVIERVAADPQGSFDLWRDADKPFAFVAACRELSRARKDPAGFVTHLPIGFDGTCNGIQHLALLSRDEEAARLVNLIDSDAPQDIYLAVMWHVRKLLDGEDHRLRTKGNEAQDAWCFECWRERLKSLTDKDRRKLFKGPVMTFPYSATLAGMTDEIAETYRGLIDGNEPWPAARFLAKAVRLACQDKLPGPVRIMKYVRDLALHRFKQGKFLEWRNPTGFPFANVYQEPQIVDIDLGSRGVRSRYTVADGALPEMRKAKILNAASPNFIHSLDAAHLVRTVLAANSEGIRDILPVHDSYSCLSPFARRFGQLTRREMATLYIVGDPLAALRDANVDDPNIFPLPERGNLDPDAVQNAEYPFM
jgi:DNA-directed RNA polymerase